MSAILLYFDYFYFHLESYNALNPINQSIQQMIEWHAIFLHKAET
jgi:hypothetical protein